MSTTSDNTDIFSNTGEQQKPVVLLSIRNEDDRALIHKQLSDSDKFIIRVSNTVNGQKFDLCIIDSIIIEHNKKTLIERKKQAAPAFLPVLLLIKNTVAFQKEHTALNLADDVLPMSAPASVLKTRAGLLLQTRMYSLQLEQKNRQLEKSHEEKQILMQEIHHRVKNNLAIISGLLEMQAVEADQQELKEILSKSRMRIFSIAKVHELIYRQNTLNQIDFSVYIRELTGAVNTLYRNPKLPVDFDLILSPVTLNINQAIPCGMILNELLTNVMKHALRNRDGGIISIRMSEEQEIVRIYILNEGIELQQTMDFLEQKTLGSTIIALLIRQLGAGFTYSTDSDGQFEIAFRKSKYTGLTREKS